VTPTIYNVSCQDGRWRMVVNRKEFGHFATEREAIRVAIETAHEAGRYNFAGAQVILHSANDMSQIIWTYGRDPFPPGTFE